MPTRRLIRVAIALAAIAGCTAAQPPPLDELPLRDALTARPDALHAMSPEARRRLALRLDAAHRAALDPRQAPTAPAAHAPAGADAVSRTLRAFDAARADRGDDTVVLVVAGGEQASAAPLIRRFAIGGEILASYLPELDGDDPTAPTHATEQRALDGKAGELLAELMADRRATRLVRVTRWPVGVVAAGDVLYVNAAWLVAMAELDGEPTPVARTSGVNDDAGVSEDPPPPPPPTDSTSKCSVADVDSSRGRRVFWIVGPLLLVLCVGHARSWKRRSRRG